MNIRYHVELNQIERKQLNALLSGGRHSARRLKRAQILLAASEGVSDEVIAATLNAADRPSIAPNGGWSKPIPKAR